MDAKLITSRQGDGAFDVFSDLNTANDNLLVELKNRLDQIKEGQWRAITESEQQLIEIEKYSDLLSEVNDRLKKVLSFLQYHPSR